MKKVAKKTEFFLDIEKEISTTGFNPSRGFYTYIEFSDKSSLWIDSKGNEIDDNNWIKKLNYFKLRVE